MECNTFVLEKNIAFGQNKENINQDCIKTPNNDIIVNKLYKLIFLHDNIINKVNNIVKSLEYQKSIDVLLLVQSVDWSQ